MSKFPSASTRSRCQQSIAKASGESFERSFLDTSPVAAARTRRGKVRQPMRHLQTTSSFGYSVGASHDTSSVAAARMRRGKVRLANTPLQTTSSFGYSIGASPDTGSVAAARMRRGKDAAAHATPPNDVVVRLQRRRFSRYGLRSRGAHATWEGAAGQYATPNDFVVRKR